MEAGRVDFDCPVLARGRNDHRRRIGPIQHLPIARHRGKQKMGTSEGVGSRGSVRLDMVGDVSTTVQMGPRQQAGVSRIDRFRFARKLVQGANAQQGQCGSGKKQLSVQCEYERKKNPV